MTQKVDAMSPISARSLLSFVAMLGVGGTIVTCTRVPAEIITILDAHLLAFGD